MTYLKLHIYEGRRPYEDVQDHPIYWRAHFKEGGVMLGGGLVFKPKGEHTGIFLNDKLLAEIKKPLAEVEALIVEAKTAGVKELDWRDFCLSNKDEEERIAPLVKEREEEKAKRAAKLSALRKNDPMIATAAAGAALFAWALLMATGVFGPKASKLRGSLGRIEEGLPAFEMTPPYDYLRDYRVEFFAELKTAAPVAQAWENVTSYDSQTLEPWRESRDYGSWLKSSPLKTEGSLYIGEVLPDGWKRSRSLDQLEGVARQDALFLQRKYNAVAEKAKELGFQEGEVHCLKKVWDEGTMTCTVRPFGAKPLKLRT